MDAELREKGVVTCCACCVGDDSGDPLDSEDLSDTECIDCIYLEIRVSGHFRNCTKAFTSLERSVRVSSFEARHGTYVALGQQTRAKLHVIIQVEGPSSLKLLTESCDGSCVRQFLHTAHPSELLMRVLGRRETRSPTGATRVILSCRVLVSIVVIIGRHYWFMKTYECIERGS